jgi:selT/selW/selH-like putative selenoprotein
LAAAIKDKFDVESKLIKGGGGIFLVIADGTTVFSKQESGRFPEHEEILASLRNQ